MEQRKVEDSTEVRLAKLKRDRPRGLCDPECYNRCRVCPSDWADSLLDEVDNLVRRLHEQAQEIARLRAQALAISASLAEFRIGPCSLPQGVIELGQRAEAAESALTAAKQEIAAMSVSPVPPTIATDDDFREVYCQGYRHALGDVVKRLAELTQAKP